MPPFLPQYKLMYWQLVAHFFFILAASFLPNEIFLIVFDFVAVFAYLQGLKGFIPGAGDYFRVKRIGMTVGNPRKLP